MPDRGKKQDLRIGMRSRTVKILLILAAVICCLEFTLQLAHLLVRDRSGTAIPAGTSTPVILCLGDSHTYGAGVVEEDSYPARLQAKLTERGFHANVVNLGAPGYNTSQLRRGLPGWLETYSPDAVVVLVGVNNGWNRKDAAWSDAADGLPVPLTTRAADFVKTRIRIVRTISILIHRLDWTRPPEESARDRDGKSIIHHKQESRSVESKEKTYERARRDLVAIIAMAKAEHAAVVFMTYVTDPEFTFETPNHLLREVAASMKVALADNDKALRPLLIRPDGSMDKAIRQELFLPDMHPNAKGHDRIAGNVMDVLIKTGVIEGSR